MKIQWYINPEGSPFAHTQLHKILTWNLLMVESVSMHEFADVRYGNYLPGEQPTGSKLLSFRPASEFTSPNRMAEARGGAMFNIDRMNLIKPSLFTFGAVLLHEIEHTLGITDHYPETDTIMSDDKYFGNENRSLLYRKDMIWINTLPFTDQVIPPKNVVFADQTGRVMIPAVQLGDKQIWVEMQHKSNNLVQVTKSSYFPNYKGDNIVFENPSLFENGILTLDKVHTMDSVIENVRLKYLGGDLLKLMGG